jgi:hypothetical protein
MIEAPGWNSAGFDIEGEKPSRSNTCQVAAAISASPEFPGLG